MERYEARRGTVQKRWGGSEHVAVSVLMEDGRLELFWLPNLDAADEEVAVWPPGPMLVAYRDMDGRQWRGFRLPFGYFVQRDTDLLILLRPDHTFVAAFGVMGADPFEVEAAVWEDAN